MSNNLEYVWHTYPVNTHTLRKKGVLLIIRPVLIILGLIVVTKHFSYNNSPCSHFASLYPLSPLTATQNTH